MRNNKTLNAKGNKMTTFQTQLIEALAAQKIIADFNGDFLNCKVAIKSGKKTKWQKFSFVFDSADDCQGSRFLPSTAKGAYSDVYAKKTSTIIVEHSNTIAQIEL